MLTAEQLEMRRKGIGGSEAAAVLGLNPYCTPYQIYAEKKEGLVREQNDEMLWGSLHEQTIRQQYCLRNKVTVEVPALIKSESHPFMLANVDGITSNKRLLEIKTSRFGHGFGESGTDEIPETYLIQVQHYLAVTMLPVADVAVLISGSEYRQYEIEADKELQDMIIEGEATWWDNYLKNIPPDPITFEEIKQRFGRYSKANAVEASDLAKDAIMNLKAIKENLKIWEEKEQEYKAIIMRELKESDTLCSSGKILVTWKLDKSGRAFLDMKALEKEHPQIYQKYLKIGNPSRRLLIK